MKQRICPRKVMMNQMGSLNYPRANQKRVLRKTLMSLHPRKSETEHVKKLPGGGDKSRFRKVKKVPRKLDLNQDLLPQKNSVRNQKNLS
jgi:hypothetical protein